jgi:signal transduction histidine kinase
MNKDLSEELEKSKKREIALMDKEKETFATVGRELSEPITGIKLTAELLRTRLITEKGTEADGYIVEKLEKIYDKADDTGIMLSSILSTALDDLGEYIVNCSDIESRTLEDMIRKYDYRHVVTMSVIPHVLIHIDAGRMSRVIGNIIENSYKYANTPIDISFLLTDDFLQMKIADHGPGVPEDEINYVTDRFFRGRDWVDSVEEGSGLGLFLAKTFMEKMDGNLYVDNTTDGLCVTLLIRLS